jgi:hypothetical protein
LCFITLKKEAKRAVKDIALATDEVVKKRKDKDALQKLLGNMKKISYNIRSNLDGFVVEFINYEGIKEIMMFIEEAQTAKSNDLITVACQMMSGILAYKVGIDSITKRAKRYMEKFLDLSTLNQSTKKQCARIFLNLAKSNLPEVFDVIEKTAIKFAEDTETMPYKCLMEGLNQTSDVSIAMTLLKFINEMLFKSEGEEKKQAKFLAKLEGLGIKDMLQKWYQSDNEDI